MHHHINYSKHFLGPRGIIIGIILIIIFLFLLLSFSKRKNKFANKITPEEFKRTLVEREIFEFLRFNDGCIEKEKLISVLTVDSKYLIETLKDLEEKELISIINDAKKQKDLIKYEV